MQDFVIIKKGKVIKVIIDKKIKTITKDYCYLIGNIYNINDLDNSNNTITKKIVNLYNLYQNDLFDKLNGNYLIILVINGKIIIAKDKMGSKQFYYTKIKEEFICSNNLKYLIANYKNNLKIDKQQLANYLSYNYILEPYTIFKQVKKLAYGEILEYDHKFKLTKYFNMEQFYKNNKNKIRNYNLAERKLTNSLKESINLITKDYQKIGVFFSAGIDSTLIASYLKETDKDIHTFTIGFTESERNEAIRSKKIAKFLNTNHHEYYLTEENIKEIVNLIPKIYSEPFADPSIIPTIFLNSQVKDMDIYLSGDGADQLFCGSNSYKYWSLRNMLGDIKQRILHIFNKNVIIFDPYLSANSTLSNYYEPASQIYCLINKNKNNQINFMSNDQQTFLATRLFTKVNQAAMYYHNNLAHPFVLNKVVKTSYQMKHHFKYKSNKNLKYILKNIVYQKIPQNYLNQKKNGFGIPLEKYLYNIFYNDIIKFSNYEILKKQNLFDKKFLKLLEKLQNKSLDRWECKIVFAYYIFQLWYQEYIDDLWREK